jgi:plastocyanin
MAFPISPVDGQTTTINGITYVYSAASNSWTRQPTGFVNIDAAGNISAAGNITGQNFYTAGEVSATGNITGNYFIGNGSQLTGVTASSVDANALTGNTLSSNVIYSSLTTVGTLANLSVTGDINTSSNISATANITGDNITAVGDVVGNNLLTVGVISAAGNITGGNVYTVGEVSATANITGGNVYTIGEISATGNVTGGNISTTGNITANYYFGNGSQLTDVIATNIYANALIGNTLSSNVLYSSLTSLGTLSNLSVSGNITAGDANLGNAATANYFIGDGGLLANITGANVTGTVANANFATYAGTAYSVDGGNVSGQVGNALIAGTVYSNDQPNITSVGTLTSLSVSGNIEAQNASFANAAFASGNISLPTQLATKQYVDNAVSTGLQIHESVNVSTTTNLVSTYTPGGTTPTITAITGGSVLTSVGSNLVVNDQVIPSASSNGLIAGKPYFVYSVPNANSFTLTASWQGPQITTFFNGTGLSIPTVANPGIGATLTNAGTQAALVIDSIPLSVTNRVLVQYQANTALNGVYTVSNIGNATTNWVMTRSLDTDQYYPQSQFGIGAGAYFYVQSGNIVGGDSYVVTTPGIIVVGTTGIDFAQFSGAVTYTGVSPVVVIGQTISLANLTGTGDTVVLNNSPTLIAPNIGNAVGNSLSVVGNIQTANYFVGDGYYISNINAANVSTTKISNGNSQANIGTIGGNLDITISSNSVAKFYDSGLSVTGAISATGNVTGNYILGNGYFLTGVITSVANINNGTSNITVVSADGNIIVGVSGVGNVVVFAPTGEYVTGVLSASGNVTGANLLTSGAISAIGTITSAANIVGGNLLTNGLISATSTITAGQFVGNGNTISNIQGANVSGNVTSAVTAGTVTTNAQPNITSVGTLTSVTSSGLVSTTGNLVGANILTSGIISANGNITTSGYFVGNVVGNISGNITVPGANTQVLYNNQGNVGASSGFTFDQLTNAMVVFGNVTGANLITNGGTFTPNVTNTVGNVQVTANTKTWTLSTDGNLYTPESGQIRASSPFYGITVADNSSNSFVYVDAVEALIQGNNFVRLQTNGGTQFDFSNGLLNAGAALISTTGNIVSANFLTGGFVSAAGNITGSYIVGNGSALTGVNFSQLADANTALLTINDVYLQGVTNLAVNHTGATAYTFDQYPGSNPDLYAIAGTTLAFDLTTAGHPFQIQDGSGIDYNTGLYHVTSAGVVSQGLAAQGKTSGTLYWKIPGNISGNYKYQCANHPVMVGNIVIQSSNIANALSTYTGNITANNISAVGNVLAATVSTTGNITANYYFGNGSQLTGIITQVSNISNGTSNVNIASANANVTVSINGTPNVATFATTGEYVTGEISATGNITGNYIIGNGAILTGVNFSQLADANTANLTINEVYLQGVTNLVVNHTGATGYTFDQYPGLNPSLYAIAGTTLAFDLTTVGHPFQIQDSGGVDYNTGLYHVTTTGVVSTGVSAQGKTSGTLYWKIPGDLTGNYKYQCANHPVMNGPIVIQAANLGNALSTYTGDITAGNISVTGNITGANVNTANLSLSGNVVSDLNITGNVNANNANFVNGAFASGTVNLPTQLTTKQYVDNAVSSGLHIHQAVNVSTTTNLVSTYTTGGTSVTVTAISGGNLLTAVGSNLAVNEQVIPSASSNGLVAGFPYFVYSAPNANSFTLSAVFGGAQVTTFTNGTGLSIPTVANPGVGAYLTNAGTQAALVIDSVPVAVTNRVLVQFQSNGALNGIYTVSNVGNATTNWVMTRSLDADQYYPQSDLGIGSGDYFFVQSGNTLGGSSYVLTTPGELVIGTTPLTFAQFSGAVVYTGVSPVVVSGQTISLANLTGTGDTVVLNNTPVLIAPNLGNATGNSVSVSGNVTADQVVSTVATGTAPFTVTSTTKVANLYVDQASLSDKSSVTFTAANVQYPTFAYANLTGVYRLESNTNFSANFANGTFSALTFAGNLTGATASLTGNVVGGNVLFGTGIVSGTGNIFANLITATTTNSTTVSASGNVTGGNLLFGTGIVSGTGNIFGNIGTITTVNSTTVSASGNVTGGNILTAGQLITTVAVGTAPLVVASNTRVANLNVASADIADRANVTFAAANIQYPTFAYAGITGTYPLQSNTAFSANFANGAFSATLFSGNLTGTTASLSGNVTGGNILTVGLISATSTITSAANITGANLLTGGQITATGNITTAGFFLGTFAGSISGNVTAPGANTQVVYNNSGNLAGSTGFTFNQASNALVVTGNVTGANLLTGGLISATSTITAGQFIGNGNTISNIQGANVSGNVTSAITAGTVTTNAQPNITSVGTLTSITSSGLVSTTGNLVGANILTAGLMSSTGNTTSGNVLTGGLITATGNIIGGNILTIGLVSSTGNAIHGNILTAGLISATGNITGNYIVGNGSLLTSITGGNVTGQVGNALIAGTVYTNAQPNITSVGTLTSLSITGNTTSGNLLTAGLISATGNATAGNLLTGGQITATGNITTAGFFLGTFAGSISGNVTAPGANTQVVYNNSGNLAGSTGFTFNQASNALVVTGNITGANILTGGFVSATSTITSAANISGANLLTGGLISATSTITAGQFIGNGNTISNIQGANVSGNVTSAVTAGTVTTNAQPNITSVGTLTSITSSGLVSTTGNLVGANILTAGLISATSTITSAANITGANLLTGGLISATSTITGGQFIGNGNTISNIQGANVSGNVTSAVTAGTVTTNAQPNITSVGTLTSITSSGLVSTTGNLVGANILTSGLISATSTITSAANITGANIITAGLISATGNLISGGLSVTGNAIIVGNLQVNGNVTFIGSNVITTNDLYIELANNQTTYANINNAGLAVGPTTAPLTYWQYQTAANAWTTNVAISATSNVIGGNILTAGLISATSTITSAANITGANITTAGLITATGNVIGGNVLTSGLISATSNIAGGNLLTSGQVSATGNITTSGFFVGTFAGSISGNVTAPGANTQVIYNNNGNLAASAAFTFIQSSNALIVTGNVTGANITTAGVVTATGNITGGNIITSGQVSAVGNVSVGNASAVNWANATGTRAYTYYNNATSSLDTVFI